MFTLRSLFESRDTRSIAELEQIAHDLEAEKSRFERIFRGENGYGFLDWDVVNHKIKWSGGFWLYMGYTDKDMEYLTDPDVGITYVHEDDREYLQRVIRSVLKGEEQREVIFRFRNKKGDYVLTELRFEVEAERSGWVRYISGVAYDITQLKQTEEALVKSEKRHSRIIKSSNDGIWEWTAKRGEFHFSDRCWQQLGYLEADDNVTRGQDRMAVWRELIHDEDKKKFDDALQEHIALNKPYDIEYRMRGKDGSWRWIRSRGQMAFNDFGDALRMSGTNMDITELKKAEERVIRAKEQAEKANNAKSEFLSSMSHELRTPLNAILAYSQILEMDTNIGEVQKENNHEIMRAGLHLKQLVGDVLDLAKIEAGGTELQMEATNAYSLVQDCLRLVRTQVQSKNIKIVLQSNNNQQSNVLASTVHLRQVLLNLLTNAIKYNCENGSIDIQLSQTSDLKLQIDIADTGCGIPAAMHSKIFQPFSRLSLDSNDVEGSGVGLVITEKLVKEMGGEIGFSSTENEGSVFWVRLPLNQDNLSGKQNLTKGDFPEASADDMVSLRVTETKTILYIEDNLSNQRVMSKIISRFPSLNLVMENEGVRGIYSARMLKPDLILVDISLPGMDGYEILEILNSTPATQAIPILALSANAMSEDVERGVNLGFRRYLTKPIDVGELLSAFNTYLSDQS